jgi:hypothetical protein
MAVIGGVGDQFLFDLLDGSENSGESDDESSIDDVLSISSDAAVVLPPALDGFNLHEIVAGSSDLPIPNIAPESVGDGCEDGVQNDDVPPELSASQHHPNDDDSEGRKPPKHRSIAHHVINN